MTRSQEGWAESPSGEYTRDVTWRMRGAKRREVRAVLIWRIKSEYVIFSDVPIRSCRVTIQDMDGVSHTVEVTAATLYEGVARGLAALGGNEGVAGIAPGASTVKVAVADVRGEHEVNFGVVMNGLVGRSCP